MEQFVKIGEGKTVKGNSKLLVTGLGSCLVVILHDKKNKIGGVAHLMLPLSKNEVPSNPYKFVNTGIPKLLEEMINMGAKRENIIAKIVGGAKIFETPYFYAPFGIGERNILEARKILVELQVPIVAEDVGGEYGRSLEFNNETGEVAVTSYKKPPKVF